jgi:hypothetical protein
VGVAAAYSIANYVLLAPALWFIMGRVGPVRTRDLASVQLPLLAAALLIGLLAQFALRPLLGGHILLLIAVTLACSYALAVGITALSPRGRKTLGELVRLAQKAINRMLKRHPLSQDSAA